MPTSQSGFSLIELLISLLLLTIGIIGVIATQTTALKYAQQAELRSTGLELANELAEKIRSTQSDEFLAQNPYANIDFDAAKQVAPDQQDCFDHSCTPAQMADANIADWLNQLSMVLPGARAVVCFDNSPIEAKSEQLLWKCSGGTKNANLVIKIGWDEYQADHTTLPPQLALALPNIQP